MILVHVHVLPGGPSYEVKDFHPDVKRSSKGALYFRPLNSAWISASELEFIRDKHPEFAKRLVETARRETRKLDDGKPGVPLKPSLPEPPPPPPPEKPTVDTTADPVDTSTEERPIDGGAEADGDDEKKKSSKRKKKKRSS